MSRYVKHRGLYCIYTVSILYLHVLLIWQKVFSKWGDPSHHEFEFCCIIQIIQYSYHNFGLCSLHAITVSGWPMCRTRSSTCLSPMGMMGSSIGRPQPMQTPWRSSWIVRFDYFELCLSWRCFWNPWAVPAERGTSQTSCKEFSTSCCASLMGSFDRNRFGTLCCCLPCLLVCWTGYAKCSSLGRSALYVRCSKISATGVISKQDEELQKIFLRTCVSLSPYNCFRRFEHLFESLEAFGSWLLSFSFRMIQVCSPENC